MRQRFCGFSLIELAVAMFVIVLLLGSVLAPLAAQVDQRHVSDTQKYLDEIKEALIGFAVSNDRMPCPASATSAGAESPAGGGACTNNYNGFVPAVTLGVSVVDNQGFAIDPWGNRIRYAVTNANGNAFTTAGGMSAATMPALAPNLLICSTATGITASSCSGAALTTGVPALIYSTGKNGGERGNRPPVGAKPQPHKNQNQKRVHGRQAAPPFS